MSDVWSIVRWGVVVLLPLSFVVPATIPLYRAIRGDVAAWAVVARLLW
jgi:hypothetical protein